jgi:rhamnogalacturonyl hydrolase YesR
MKNALVACVGFALAPLAPAAGPTDFAPESIVGTMESVADWQLAHPAKWNATDWENGAFYAGVMALADVSQSPRFREAMVRMGEGNRWQLGPVVYSADDHVVGQTYVDLYRTAHDLRMIAPMRERFDFILAHPKDGNLVFDPVGNPDHLDKWSWCDSLFMGPAAWAKLSRATGDGRYLAFAVSKWWRTSDYLYDRDEHLYYRDSRYFTQREKNGRRVFWARGNGWVLAGLARMLQELPADHPSRERFVEQYRQMSERIAQIQNADGFWRSSLLDPESYPMQESSGTGFFCFGLSWGVNAGLLDRARFEPVVRRAWSALLTCVDPDGRLTHVQPVGYMPVTFDPKYTEPYSVGAFLLAGRQVAALSP